MRFSGPVTNNGTQWLATFWALRVFCKVPVDAGLEALAVAVKSEFAKNFTSHGMDAPEFEVALIGRDLVCVTFQGVAVEDAVRFALVRARLADLRNFHQAAKALKKKSSGYVRAYESGQRHPSVRTLDAMLRVYGAELSVVLSRPDRRCALPGDGFMDEELRQPEARE